MKKPNATFDDFLKLDIRVGEVKKCEIVENSNKLLRLQVDFGSDLGVVQILSGLAKYYKTEDLTGKKFLFLVNLEPKKMLNELSHGMILVANVSEIPTIIEVDDNLPNGSFLY